MSSTIFSGRNLLLIGFILVFLFIGTAFDVHVGPESFVEGATTKKQNLTDIKRELKSIHTQLLNIDKQVLNIISPSKNK
jgi:hypothetical protein